MKTLRRIHWGEVIVVFGVLSLLFIVSLPNFMNNQVRADLVQAVSDLRMISNAINAYYVDCHDTPPDFDGLDMPTPGNGTSHTQIFPNVLLTEIYTYQLLTTPTPYMNTIPEDVFVLKMLVKKNRHFPKEHPLYEYSNFLKRISTPNAFIVTSAGPDLDIDALYREEPHIAYKRTFHITNGLESNGDIYASHLGVILPY